MASLDDLEQFRKLPETQRHLNSSLRGALAEIATMGVIRYNASVVRMTPRDPPPPPPLEPHVHTPFRTVADVHGCCRYPWPLLRPLIEALLDGCLCEFEAFSRVEVLLHCPCCWRVRVCFLIAASAGDGPGPPCAVQVGPAPPTASGEMPAQLRKRLQGMLREFEAEAPFTLQRLCEVLLEPSKQYTRLEKLVRGAKRPPRQVCR